MELKDGKKTFYAKDREAWRGWLQKNGANEKNVWLIMYRMGAAKPSVYYSEAVEEALCFGWIDSKANKRDEESRYQFFARRNPKSNWSRLNKDRVEKLIRDGRMMPAGLALIEGAKINGAWTALDEVDALTLPKDLEEALRENKQAANHFMAFPPSVKKMILTWIGSAKTEDTRKKRIMETVLQAQKNIRANQYVKK